MHRIISFATRLSVVKDDLLVNTITEVLKANDLRVVSMTTQIAAPDTPERVAKARRLAIKFHDPSHNVIVVPAIEDCQWELPTCNVVQYSSRAKVSGRAANDPGFVKVSQNSILRISINIHCTAGELYS